MLAFQQSKPLPRSQLPAHGCLTTSTFAFSPSWSLGFQRYISIGWLVIHCVSYSCFPGNTRQHRLTSRSSTSLESIAPSSQLSLNSANPVLSYEGLCEYDAIVVVEQPGVRQHVSHAAAFGMPGR